MIKELTEHSKKGHAAGKKTFSCKSTKFQIADSRDKLSIESWRFQDWDYKRPDLPTYARGLFTYHTKDGKAEIATRGYDKFFNTDEVTTTKWAHIEKHTKGPYELSLKENGCIIFISGLSDDTLLVCSKHSTGERSDTELSHAIAGERWVDRQLRAIGKTRTDLARELRKRNATAVAELCDDDFEEHILAYKGDEAGLYLHGININTPEFTTYPGEQVQRFADDWGFKRTDFLIKDDIKEARKFLKDVAETGHYNGRDVEGFVIRCKTNSGEADRNRYRDWFFKYKFEEPYLMYRTWRECTKALIANKPPRYKKNAAITEEYLLYARRILSQNPHMGKEYQQNHGIIELRDAFLKEKNLKGSDIIRMEYAATGGEAKDVTRNVILVPIATIGCGKTTLAVALQHLFNWGHIQNDNIVGKNRPPRFAQKVMEQLMEKPVVFADRNNAERRERQQIIEDVHNASLTTRLVALNFKVDDVNSVRQVTQNRVISRGDNHQTIQAASDKKKVLGIMEGFINRYQPCNPDNAPDDGFDLVIDLDPTKDSRINLETVISKLSEKYSKLFKDMPSSDDLDAAISYALSQYRPDIRHEIGARPQQKPKAQLKENNNLSEQSQQQQKKAKAEKKKDLEYLGVNVSTQLIKSLLESTFSKLPEDKAAFFRQLQDLRRVQPKFHVTLMHRSARNQYPEQWDHYKTLHANGGGNESQIGECKILLERVVWNDRLMAIVVRIASESWASTNAVPHITVGTKDQSIKPKESNDLLAHWLAKGTGEKTGINEASLGNVEIDGSVAGVLSRH